MSVFASNEFNFIADESQKNVKSYYDIVQLGYDDDAIYYTRSSPFWKIQRSAFFDQTIYRTETRNGRLYTGTLNFTGRVTDEGNGRYRGEYTGTLYYYGRAK